MLTRAAVAKGRGGFAGVLGRGVAHTTIYLPALALYLIVLPRLYGFSTLGQLPQLFALAALFLLATSFMGQAVGAGSRGRRTRPSCSWRRACRSSSWPASRGLAKQSRHCAGLRPAFSRRFGDRWPGAYQSARASIWDVAHDWIGLWCLAIGYFILA